MSNQSLGPEQRALVDALTAEYAAVFAYGVVAAFSNPARTGQVAADTAAHRARRDATIDTLTAAGVDVPQPEPGYALPFPVTDPISAARLAAQVETDTATAWRSVIERAQSDAVRDTGIVALTESAVRAANWHVVLGDQPATTAFPGQP
ncbi:ferritin-like domain-containing protein [Prescottella sp. R16]|uniref:ferritin-like domain-containing protein n=1 Tax=Prescottella sp. R16 TaxID=3064529 RepID=UPI00272E7DE6|nr:ferritin-like domain-containing protein [Prescottella sp. R16]